MVKPENFSYRSTISNYDCMKAVEFFLNAESNESGSGSIINGTEMIFSDAINNGIGKHKIVEEWLLAKQIVRDISFPSTQLPVGLVQFVHDYPIWDALIEHRIDIVDVDFICGGTLDLILPQSGIIIDWKFPGKPWNKFKLDKYIEKQGAIYPWLVHKMGIPVKDMLFVVCPEDTTGITSTEGYDGIQIFHVPGVDNLDTVEAAMRKHKSKYRMIKNAIANNQFIASPSNWNCKWCMYKNFCSEKANGV